MYVSMGCPTTGYVYEIRRIIGRVIINKYINRREYSEGEVYLSMKSTFLMVKNMFICKTVPENIFLS